MANTSHDPLDSILLQLSAVDFFTLRAGCEGVIILGSTGAGKTSTSAKRLALALLKTSGLGGLILCVKPDEAQRWCEYLRSVGREKDLILFNRESGLRFDGIAYEWNRQDRASGDIESLLDLLMVVMTMGNDARSGGTNERFWEAQREQLMRNVIMLLSYAGEPISIMAMDRAIGSLPKSVEETGAAEWRAKSYCWSLFDKVRANHPELFIDVEDAAWRPGDMDVVADFALDYWPRLDERTRSNVLAEWSGVSSKFLFRPFADIFCSGHVDFMPEQTFTEGKVVVVDWPLLTWNQTGRIIAGLMKLIFYRAWLRRDVNVHPAPVLCWADEAQLVMLPGDRENRFAQVARSSRVVNVWITQSICNISEQLAEFHPGSKTHALLGNLTTKVFHQQTDVDTNRYAADLVGQEYQYRKSFRSSMNDPSISQNEQLAYRILPSDFSSLRRADGDNKRSEAIVVQGGKVFEGTRTTADPKGRNYLRLLFSR